MGIIDEFLDYLRYERNRSDLTVSSYGDDLHSFEAFLAELPDARRLENADQDNVRAWMEHMMDKGNSASSINRRLSSVRSFYRFALARGRVEVDPAHFVKGPKKEKPLPQFVKEKEMDRLLDEMEWGTTFKDVRARTFIILFYETGMRLSELIGLNDDDVDWSLRQIKVNGKGNKQRIIPFGDEVARSLQEYVLKRDNDVNRVDNALFVSDKGRRMQPATVRKQVQEQLSRVTTLKKKSPHVLRHSFATAMLNNNAELEHIKELLGHESVSTTQIYTHTTFEQLKREYSNAHPRA